MHRVFLANDDAASCLSVRESLRRDMPGFLLVGEADHGVALPMIRDLRPDILIADLRIPLADELNFCRQVRLNFPWIEIVLLSASDDVGHGRDAARLGIREYLIKPVSMYELNEALLRAADRQSEQRYAMTDQIREASATVPPFRRQLEDRLDRWLHGADAGNVHALETWIDRWILGRRGYRRSARYCRLLTIAPVKSEYLWMVRGLLRLIEYDIGREARLYAMDTRDGPLVAVMSDDPEDLENLAYGTAYTTFCAIERFTGERIRIQVSASADDPNELRRVYREAKLREKDQPEERPIFGEGDDLRRHPGVRPDISPLSEWMLEAGEAELTDALAKIARVSPMNDSVVVAALKWLAAEIDGPMAEMPTLDCTGSFREQMLRILQWRDARAPGFRHETINHIRSMMAGRFHLPDTPLYAVAKEAGMSVNRFSVVFAQEMGMTFTEYHTRLRVSAAKWLLVSTRKRVSGIAHSLGVEDANHFENLFRHYSGLSPREYRLENR